MAGGADVVEEDAGMGVEPSPRLAALFEEDADGIRITRDTFGPLLRQVRPGFKALGQFGYNEPITDPYGDLMRNALRRLVRTS